MLWSWKTHNLCPILITLYLPCFWAPCPSQQDFSHLFQWQHLHGGEGRDLSEPRGSSGQRERSDPFGEPELLLVPTDQINSPESSYCHWGFCDGVARNHLIKQKKTVQWWRKRGLSDGRGQWWWEGTPWGGIFQLMGAAEFSCRAGNGRRNKVNTQENRVTSKDPLSFVLLLCNYGAKGFQDTGF